MKPVPFGAAIVLAACLLVRYGLGQAGLVTSVNPLGDFEQPRPPRDVVIGGPPPADRPEPRAAPAPARAPAQYAHPFDAPAGAPPRHPAENLIDRNAAHRPVP